MATIIAGKNNLTKFALIDSVEVVDGGFAYIYT